MTQHSRTPVDRNDLDLPDRFEPPRTSLEQTITSIWSRELNVSSVGLDDDFFNLGGDSLSATNISVAVSEHLDCRFDPTMVFEKPTVREVVEWIGDTAAEKRELPECLVTLRQGSELPPLFIIHGRGGLTFPKPKFMNGFHPEQPVFAFQVPGYRGSAESFDDIESIAQTYLDAMLKTHPSGPWFLAAFCNGSWIAVEIVRLLKARSLSPEFVVLLDPAALNGDMRETYISKKGAIACANIPAISSGWIGIKRLYFRIARRAHCFWYTRQWVDFKSREAYNNPSVKQWMIDRRVMKLERKRSEVRKELENDSGTAATTYAAFHSAMDGVSNQVAAQATAKMQTAFWNHNPNEPSDFEYDLIVSSERANELRDPLHPLNRIMRKAHIIESGESHTETVGALSAQNSSFMQKKILDFVR
ncbi:MAG: phosphopantetheine-binding protein [Pseudomonadota bacterium]